MAPKQSAATGREDRSDADVAEIDYRVHLPTKAKHVTARLIVRRVKDMNPNNQSELFTAYRNHAVFTNSPLSTLEAEKAHRAHAIVEQVIADLKNGPLAHLPSGQFATFNLTRAAGVLASTFHAKATAGTIRAQLITLPGRLARSARQLTLHLPIGWPWQAAWHQLATAANSPTLAA